MFDKSETLSILWKFEDTIYPYTGLTFATTSNKIRNLEYLTIFQSYSTYVGETHRHYLLFKQCEIFFLKEHLNKFDSLAYYACVACN